MIRTFAALALTTTLALPQAAAAEGAPAAVEAELVSPGALTACLARNGGIMSSRRTRGGAGFDYLMLETIAEDMGLTLQVVWFEGEQDEHAEPVPENYAMLSLPLCDIVAAHPDFPGAYGAPPVPRAKPPRWDDRPEHMRYVSVDLKPVAVTAPYMRAEQAVILGPDVALEDVTSLDDLAGLKIGVQQGTLAEAILRRQGPPEAMARAVTVSPGPNFLFEMEKGLFEATLTDVAAYDFHQRQNMLSKLRLTSFRHELGLNIAFAVLAENAALKDAVDGSLSAILAEGGAERIAKKARMTYAPPGPGAVVTFRTFSQ